MRSKKHSLGLTALLAVFSMTTFSATERAAAQTETILYSFSNLNNGGEFPNGGLIADAKGNLYGTAGAASSTCTGSGCGTVFVVSPKTGGGWALKVLHTFSRNGTDGWNPVVGVALDAAGNVYGTTYAGGAYGEGVAFKLTRKPGTTTWTEQVVHSFGAYQGDGLQPQSSLLIDATGRVFGTTYFGGAHGYGTVFELAPKAGGTWLEAIVHNFNNNGVDGIYPQAQLIFDAAGNLYGTTTGGGASGGGTAFQLTPKTGGGWTQNTLYSFATAAPSRVTMGSDGSLYGTDNNGGTNSLGSVFKLSPATGGWTQQVLYSFCSQSSCPDGQTPTSGVTIDASGNLYGVTAAGGAYFNGTAFKLTPGSGGTYSESTLHSFGNTGDGFGLFYGYGLVFGAGSNLYGTTPSGGANNYGTVFEITP
jgi:uncharacterized repeat protein (TIGR03803 family)